MSNIFKESIDVLKVASESTGFLYADEIQYLEDSLIDDEFNIAVIGEFSVGKSTFLNALIGRRLLYAASQEATGVSTRITNSDKKIAEIYGDVTTKIDLSEKDSYKKLIPYFDRDNVLNKDVEGIQIEYPIKALSKNVSVLDTPGLQGLGDREVKIAKEALREANATIIIIEPKGITGSELKLLKGELEGFGKITTKKCILLINKIGTFFDDNTYEKALEKIEKCKADVRNKLIDNGISDAEIFALDSRDYLWSVDDELYEESIEKNQNVLSQKEYRERSNFDEFLNYLEKFLLNDNKNKIIHDETRENLLVLFDEFKKVFSGDNEKLNGHLEKEIRKIEVQKEILLENRRKMINETKRQLVSTVIDFKESLNKDIAEDVKEEKKKIRRKIDLIKNENDFNEENEKRLLDLVNSNVSERLEFYKNIIGEYKDIIIQKTKETFEKSVRVNLKTDVSINFSSDYSVFKQDESNEEKQELRYKKELDKNEDRLESREIDLLEARKSLEKSEQELDKFRRSLKSQSYKFQLESKINSLKYDRESEVLLLGSKPSPRAKYRTEYITKKRFLFWGEKTVEKEVFNGYDYSECERWEDEKDLIYIKYDNLERKLRKEIADIEGQDNELKSKTKIVEIYRKQVKSLEEEIDFVKKEIADLKEKNEYAKEIYLGEKKSKLYEVFSMLISDYFKGIDELLENKFDEFKKNLREKVDKEASDYLDKYEKDLNKEYEKLREKLKLAREKNKIDLSGIEIAEKRLLNMEE